MNKELDFFRDIFNNDMANIQPAMFCFQLVLVTLLCLVISYLYVKYGNSLSNRNALSSTFVLIGVTTMLIITIVKSSLALSLGLVGALSIVRFRTAIKEPEELAYFFMVIGIGLGVGAEQILVTVIGTIGLGIIIIFMNRSRENELNQNLIIHIEQVDQISIQVLLDNLDAHCSQLELKRLEETGSTTELSLNAQFNSVEKLLNAKNELRKAHPSARFSFLQIV